jgi:hypothetical protein
VSASASTVSAKGADAAARLVPFDRSVPRPIAANRGAARLCHDDPVLKLPGYTDAPLIDGCEVLDDPLFWPVHLLQYTGGDPDELCAAFDVDEAEIWRSYRRLSDEHRWPAFSISLPSGHLFSLVYRNFKEDSGYDYV